jgi:hypothetical protein
MRTGGEAGNSPFLSFASSVAISCWIALRWTQASRLGATRCHGAPWHPAAIPPTAPIVMHHLTGPRMYPPATAWWLLELALRFEGYAAPCENVACLTLPLAGSPVKPSAPASVRHGAGPGPRLTHGSSGADRRQLGVQHPPQRDDETRDMVGVAPTAREEGIHDRAADHGEAVGPHVILVREA